MTDIVNPRVKLLTQRLTEALSPEGLTVIDDSAAHAGHSGAQQSGGGHFSIEVIASVFNDKSAIERHRMIYVALGDAMGTEIHAVSINAKTPNEVTSQQEN